LEPRPTEQPKSLIVHRGVAVMPRFTILWELPKLLISTSSIRV